MRRIVMAVLLVAATVARGEKPAPKGVIDGKPAAEWLKQLRGDRAEDRKRAAATVGTALKDARALTPATVAALLTLADDDPTASFEALLALGPPAAPLLAGPLL